MSAASRMAAAAQGPARSAGPPWPRGQRSLRAAASSRFPTACRREACRLPLDKPSVPCRLAQMLQYVRRPPYICTCPCLSLPLALSMPIRTDASTYAHFRHTPRLIHPPVHLCGARMAPISLAVLPRSPPHASLERAPEWAWANGEARKPVADPATGVFTRPVHGPLSLRAQV